MKTKTREGVRTTGYTVGAVLLGCLVFVGVIFLSVVTYRFVISPAKEANRRTDIQREINLSADEQERLVNDPNRRLYQYDHFFDLKAEADSLAVQIDTAEATFTAYAASNPAPRSFQAQAEYDRLNSVLLGLRNHRAQIVAQYNADAQNAQRGVFRDARLPETIS